MMTDAEFYTGFLQFVIESKISELETVKSHSKRKELNREIAMAEQMLGVKAAA